MLFLGDSNAHVHSRKLDEMAHAAHFMDAMRDLSMHVALNSKPVVTFRRPGDADEEEEGVQDDYIAVANGVSISDGSLRSVVFAHGAAAGITSPSWRRSSSRLPTRKRSVGGESWGTTGRSSAILKWQPKFDRGWPVCSY